MLVTKLNVAKMIRLPTFLIHVKKYSTIHYHYY